MGKYLNKYANFAISVLLSGSLFAMPWPAGAVTSPGTDLQSQIDAAVEQISSLNQKIAQYKSELAAVGQDKKTLQSAIKTLDLQRATVETQIEVTQRQIDTTQLQIKKLSTQIASKKESVAMYKAALMQSLKDLNKLDNQSTVVQLFTSGSLSELWQNINGEMNAQDSFRDKAEQYKTEAKNLATAQSAMQEKEDALAEQNKTLTAQKQTLSATVTQKKQLLVQTNNKESTYQKLLSEAEAELKSFSNFTKNAGGAKLLPNQTVCDDWGCYYNQRDALWGGIALNGTGYTLASDGCLVTSMAMVMTHYGYRNVTPATINANPTNFASYFPAFLMYTINVAGVTATRVAASIDTTLASGNPVVVGMKVKGGTHFVVLVSGQNGSYTMRDPYVANGKDVDFSSYYNVKSIYSITKVVIGS